MYTVQWDMYSLMYFCNIGARNVHAYCTTHYGPWCGIYTASYKDYCIATCLQAWSPFDVAFLSCMTVSNSSTRSIMLLFMYRATSMQCCSKQSNLIYPWIGSLYCIMYSMNLTMKQIILAIVNFAHLGSRSCDLLKQACIPTHWPLTHVVGSSVWRSASVSTYL